jgi:hypothetical protein
MPKDKKIKPNSTELKSLRDWLKARGMSNADATKLVKGGATWGEIDLQLRDDLRKRPKKDEVK